VVQDNDTVLWRMTGASGRILECVIRFAPGGVEVEIRSDGSEMITTPSRPGLRRWRR